MKIIVWGLLHFIKVGKKEVEDSWWEWACSKIVNICIMGSGVITSCLCFNNDHKILWASRVYIDEHEKIIWCRWTWVQCVDKCENLQRIFLVKHKKIREGKVYWKFAFMLAKDLGMWKTMWSFEQKGLICICGFYEKKQCCYICIMEWGDKISKKITWIVNMNIHGKTI